MRLQEKVSIVTGGGSGIGRAIAIMFAGEGSKVVVAGRGIEAGEETVAKIRANGGEAVFIKTDVTNPKQVQNLVKATVDAYGKLDVIVNSAGNWALENPYIKGVPILQLPLEIWHKLIEVNLTSVFLVCKYGMTEMWKIGSGSIINIGSTSGVGGSTFTAYSTTKAGVHNLTRCLAVSGSLEGRQIRVNCIAPSEVETPQSLASLDFYQNAVHMHAEPLFPGKAASGSSLPEEVAYCAVYLASEESCGVTGAIFMLDRGATCH